jgi:hypothetical protein
MLSYPSSITFVAISLTVWQDLIGLDPDINGGQCKVFVRDLPLHALPIIRDDLPLYDLLNMFQFGMSRYGAHVCR